MISFGNSFTSYIETGQSFSLKIPSETRHVESIYFLQSYKKKFFSFLIFIAVIKVHFKHFIKILILSTKKISTILQDHCNGIKKKFLILFTMSQHLMFIDHIQTLKMKKV